MTSVREIPNWINGKACPPASGKWMDVCDPRTGNACARVAVSNEEDVKIAVEAAKVAFAKWSRWTVKERMKPLLKLRELIQANESKFCDIVVEENGKNRVEALGSTRKGNETLEYACGMPALIPGKFLEVSNGVECKEFRMPMGVCASIVPFNFPIMVPMWTMPICIATGNVQILKPSEKVPGAAFLLAKLATEAGLPDGVFQVVNGLVPVVNALCDAPAVKAVTFVGSTKVAKIVAKRCRNLDPPKRVVALGGAKNHMIAMPDCKINMCAVDVVNSFAGTSGQRCMAAANLVLVGGNDELLQAVIKEADSRVRGTAKKQLGPVIDKASQERILGYIDDAEKNGGEILLDGRRWAKEMKEGFWVGPTVIKFKDTSHKCLHDEIFGPVLSVIDVKHREEAIAIENANRYGNAACIYTTSGEHAQYFYKRFSAGMIGVNIGVPVPREPFAFGGYNDSKIGDFDITDDGGIEFFTWRKKVTTKWVPPERKTWMD